MTKRERLLEEPEAVGQPGSAEAIVVFEDRADRSVLRLLQPGFRHCFCLIGRGQAWTICDPLKTRIELQPLLGLGKAEIARHYAGLGRRVLLGRVGASAGTTSWSLRPVSCVEIVKRLLHLHAPAVFTPAQLHRRLCREGWIEPLDVMVE
jgi:hypothetical protein